MKDGIKQPRVANHQRVLVAAAIEFGTTSIPCTIRTISESGAEIAELEISAAGKSLFKVGDSFLYVSHSYPGV